MSTQYKAIVLGTSAGGFKALQTLIPILPGPIPLAFIIVQHLNPDNHLLASLVEQMTSIPVVEIEDKLTIEPNHIYVAPPGYHVFIERNHRFSLSVDELVNHARPSIDVLFESAALAFNNQLIGILLTGSNTDGANGLKAIQLAGGMVIVQDPMDAESPIMPAAGLQTTHTNLVMSIQEMGLFLEKTLR